MLKEEKKNEEEGSVVHGLSYPFTVFLTVMVFCTFPVPFSSDSLYSCIFPALSVFLFLDS